MWGCGMCNTLYYMVCCHYHHSVADNVAMELASGVYLRTSENKFLDGSGLGPSSLSSFRES